MWCKKKQKKKREKKKKHGEKQMTKRVILRGPCPVWQRSSDWMKKNSNESKSRNSMGTLWIAFFSFRFRVFFVFFFIIFNQLSVAQPCRRCRFTAVTMQMIRLPLVSRGQSRQSGRMTVNGARKAPDRFSRAATPNGESRKRPHEYASTSAYISLQQIWRRMNARLEKLPAESTFVRCDRGTRRPEHLLLWIKFFVLMFFSGFSASPLGEHVAHRQVINHRRSRRYHGPCVGFSVTCLVALPKTTVA